MSGVKRPTWVTVVGVLLIVFGGFGLLGSGQLTFMPKMMSYQQDMMESMFERAKANDPEAEQFLESMESMWDMPEWFGTFAMFFGIIGIILHAFYLFAGIKFIQFQSNSLKLAYLVLALSVLYSMTQCIVGSTMDSFIGFIFIAGGVISICIDIILIVVIAASDKSSFGLLETGPNLSTQ